MIRDTISLLFLLPSFTFGGAERTSLNLLRSIDKTRFRISLITSRNIFQRFKNCEIQKLIPLEDLGIDVWFNNLNRFTEDTKKVAALLGKEKPDLAFGMMHYPSSLLVFAKKLNNLKLKVIASPRGPSSEYLEYFEHDFYRKLFLRRLFSFCCKYADGLVVASQGMKEECIEDFHAFPERVIVIPNSVDFKEIRKKADEGSDLKVPSGFCIISALGRLEKEKNIPFLLKAFSELRKKEKAKLLIIGDGTEKRNLERLSKKLNIEEDVLFIGFQSNPYKFIKMSDIFVHTCLFEGFANAIIEAMACSVSVIAIDCPYGPRDIIKNGENGLLIPMNDEGALVDAIVKLFHDKRLRDNVSETGAEKAMEFSLKSMVQKYESFFYSVLR
jgi:glycosyltransferase involved in cell wall biosynthesis